MSLVASGDVSQFGLTTDFQVDLPITISTVKSLATVAVGWSHLAYLDVTGSAYGLGNDKTAVLGTGTRTIHSTPTPINLESESITFVACTQFDTASVT
jgi:alpha-tubulin suppressor-like RCC1 family protein